MEPEDVSIELVVHLVVAFRTFLAERVTGDGLQFVVAERARIIDRRFEHLVLVVVVVSFRRPVVADIYRVIAAVIVPIAFRTLDDGAHGTDFQTVYDAQRSIDAARELFADAFVVTLFEHRHGVVVVDSRREEVFAVLGVVAAGFVNGFGRVAQYGLPHDELVGIGAFSGGVRKIIIHFQPIPDERLAHVQTSAEFFVPGFFHQPDVVGVGDAGAVVEFCGAAR